MGGSGRMGRWSDNTTPLAFFPKRPLGRACLLVQTEDGSKFRGLKKGEKWKRSLTNSGYMSFSD